MIDLVARFVIPATFELLPNLASREAAILLLAIGLQESRFQHRRQVGGPARGYWQFERGGLRGVLRHRATATLAQRFAHQLGYPLVSPEGTDADVDILHPALQHNDILACGFARLLLFTLPDALPGAHEPDRAWANYLNGWRPGKPHRATWDALHDAAVVQITGQPASSTTRLA